MPLRENGVAHANLLPAPDQVANILLMLFLKCTGVFFSAANVFPFNINERLACEPDGGTKGVMSLLSGETTAVSA
jgi:hypothetical protein